MTTGHRMQPHGDRVAVGDEAFEQVGEAVLDQRRLTPRGRDQHAAAAVDRVRAAIDRHRAVVVGRCRGEQGVQARVAVFKERSGRQTVQLLQAAQLLHMMWSDAQQGVVVIERAVPVDPVRARDGVEDVGVVDGMRTPLELHRVEIAQRHHKERGVGGLEVHGAREPAADEEGAGLLQDRVVEIRRDADDRVDLRGERVEHRAEEGPVRCALGVEHDAPVVRGERLDRLGAGFRGLGLVAPTERHRQLLPGSQRDSDSRRRIA